MNDLTDAERSEGGYLIFYPTKRNEVTRSCHNCWQVLSPGAWKKRGRQWTQRNTTISLQVYICVQINSIGFSYQFYRHK